MLLLLVLFVGAVCECVFLFGTGETAAENGEKWGWWPRRRGREREGLKGDLIEKSDILVLHSVCQLCLLFEPIYKHDISSFHSSVTDG